jgi:hypothetical protein
MRCSYFQLIFATKLQRNKFGPLFMICLYSVRNAEAFSSVEVSQAGRYYAWFGGWLGKYRR